MGLVEPVPLLAPSELGRLHFVAAGGAGMSPVAGCYAALGLPVSGCDQVGSATLDKLARAGVDVHIGHDPAHVAGADTMVVSSAIRPENPELTTARAAGRRIWHRSAALGALMLGRAGIAVTGTHGKTTTSAMLFTALAAAGADPSAVLGAPLAATGQSCHIGTGDAFVIEADESDGSFLQYPAQTIVITNIEADHLDNWGTPQAYAAGFERLARGDDVRTVVLDVDDPGAARLAASVAGTAARLIGVGTDRGAEVRLSELAGDGPAARAVLRIGGQEHLLRLAVPGVHNLRDAALAVAAGWAHGADPAALLDGLASFTGAARRFQRVGEARGVRVVDDYAHHPTELAVVLRAARPLVGGGRLVACFQPHLFTRTRDFAPDFGVSLAGADLVVVTDVYAAREDPIPGVTGELVARGAAAAGARVVYEPDLAALPARLAGLVRDGDLVITLGAGDVTEIGPALLRELGGGEPDA